MLVRIPKGWQIPERQATPERLVLGRRRVLGSLLAAGGALFVGSAARQSETVSAQLPVALRAKRSLLFEVDGPLSDERPSPATTTSTSSRRTRTRSGSSWTSSRPGPGRSRWRGCARSPRPWIWTTLARKMPLEERLYRHRCVEAWSMAVPWTGFPLKALLDLVEPKPEARFVRFVSFLRHGAGARPAHPDLVCLAVLRRPQPGRGDQRAGSWSPASTATRCPSSTARPSAWRCRGSTATSPKSIVRIEFVKKQPQTFWNDLAPDEYGFVSNVDPTVPHPRWSQATERHASTARRAHPTRRTTATASGSPSSTRRPDSFIDPPP